MASLLFPRICLGCGKEARWICNDCLKTIGIIKQPFCPECRRPTEVGEFCSICRGGVSPPALDGIFICANFEEGVLKEAIHQFKYNGISDIGGLLGKIMAGKLKSIPVGAGFKPAPTFNLIIPVPLHRKRLRQRGFNQAEILSRGLINHELSRISHEFHELGKPVLMKNILVRKKYTVPQMELDREQRLNNLKGIFELKNVGAKGFLQEKNILLVDDVTTTGATLEECARVLKQNGAKSVWGIVLAKGK